jgi:hypothetical protein
VFDLFAVPVGYACLMHISTRLRAQGKALQPISRFQAAAVGDDIYLHTHRNVDNIMRLSKVEDGELRCG